MPASLADARVFSDLADDDLEALSAEAEIRILPDGAIAAGQGQPAPSVLFVLAGCLRATRRSAEDGLTYSGPDCSAGADACLAEAVTGSPSAFTYTASGPARVAFLAADALAVLCDEHPAVGAAVRRALAWRVVRDRTAWPVVDLARVEVDDQVIALMTPAQVQKHRAVPLALNGGVAVVAFVDPQDVCALDDVRRILPGVRVRPVGADAVSFDRFCRARVLGRPDRKPDASAAWFRGIANKVHDVRVIEPTAPATAAEEKARQVPGEQVIQLMGRLIGEAIDLGASDIHIEPTETELFVRYRVDGLLKRRPGALDLRFHAPLVSRIKALGRMDIAEKRRAQDGRLTATAGRRQVDFRLSTVPSLYGEKIVLRLLDPGSILIDLERLVTNEPAYRAVRWMLDQRQGMMVIAGPTGSGKTTTLYSALLRLRQDDINILTIEDPVEYTIEGVTQVQVNEPAGVTFANTVRTFLRQDPDVILVGETRDPLTASTSVEAALTGHLVLTTLHANDAPGALVRLREMGVESFLLAHTVVGIISQRLVRRICPQCREPTPYHPQMVRPLGILRDDDPATSYTFYRGRGCVHCNHQGFRGRAGVFEILRIDDRLRPLVASGASGTELAEAARALGLFLPMADYCRHLLTEGVTTPEEIARVLFIEK